MMKIILSGHQRNQKCHCGSGKKYKRCHYLIDSEDNEKFKDDYRKMKERELKKLIKKDD